jgi:monoamine oxidase
MKKIFINRIARRRFLKTSLSGLALATLPGISFAQSNPDVVVIGAGSAGLSASAELMRRGISFVCIEGMNRIGGRCYTDMSTFGVPADIGGHWLHGFSGNQIAEFGKEHKDKFKVYNVKKSRTYVYDGGKKVEADKLWDIVEKIQEIKDTRVLDVPLIDLIPEKIKKNSWFDTAHKIVDDARDLGNFTLGDDSVNWQDPGKGDGLCREGYGALLAYYRKDVPVKLNTIVNEIKWGGKGVQVVTNKGTINAKACIVTVSLGVLKAEKIKFTPALPLRKLEAFEGMSMTISNRVLMQLKKKFMGKFKDLRLFTTKIDFVVNNLKSAWGSKFYEKYFIKAIATGWANNPFTLGAYSGAIPGKGRSRPELKRQVGDRIFFAGEATAYAFSTVHGADRSGVRAVTDLFISPALG